MKRVVSSARQSLQSALLGRFTTKLYEPRSYCRCHPDTSEGRSLFLPVLFVMDDASDFLEPRGVVPVNQIFSMVVPCSKEMP